MGKGKNPRHPAGSQSISRAVELLTIVGQSGDAGSRLVTIAEKSGLHIATARRILQTLVSGGLLAFNERTKIYVIGPAIFSVAVMGSPWFARRQVFQQAIEHLANVTRDTVLFSIRSGREAVCLARHEGQFPIRVLSLDVGSRRPLGAGSGSAAIMAYIPEAEQEVILQQNALQYAPFNISVRDVRKIIDEGKRTGFTFNPGLIIEGVYGVGVPILVGGVAVASISITTIASRMQEGRHLELVRAIRSELAEIPGIELAPFPSVARTKVAERGG